MQGEDREQGEENGQTKRSPYHDFSNFPSESNHEPAPGETPTSTTKDPTFAMKLHVILSNPEFQDIISWLPHGRSWRVLHQKKFEELVMPRYFRHSRCSSFMRQVNGWGFCRVTHGSDYNSYFHELFLRGKPRLCEKMRRLSTNKKRKAGEIQIPDFYALSCENPLPETSTTPAAITAIPEVSSMPPLTLQSNNSVKMHNGTGTSASPHTVVSQEVDSSVNNSIVSPDSALSSPLGNSQMEPNALSAPDRTPSFFPPKTGPVSVSSKVHSSIVPKTGHRKTTASYLLPSISKSSMKTTGQPSLPSELSPTISSGMTCAAESRVSDLAQPSICAHAPTASFSASGTRTLAIGEAKACAIGPLARNTTLEKTALANPAPMATAATATGSPATSPQQLSVAPTHASTQNTATSLLELTLGSRTHGPDTKEAAPAFTKTDIGTPAIGMAAAFNATSVPFPPGHDVVRDLVTKEKVDPSQGSFGLHGQGIPLVAAGAPYPSANFATAGFSGQAFYFGPSAPTQIMTLGTVVNGPFTNFVTPYPATMYTLGPTTQHAPSQTVYIRGIPHQVITFNVMTPFPYGATNYGQPQTYRMASSSQPSPPADTTTVSMPGQQLWPSVHFLG